MADKKLSGKTKFSIDVRFASNVPTSRVPLRAIQRGSASGSTAVAITDEVWSNATIEIKWEQLKDPIAKKTTLSIKELKVSILFQCSVRYAREIDPSSACFAHVRQHEQRHVESRKQSLNRHRMLIIDYIKENTSPKMADYVEVKDSQAPKVRNDAFKRIDKALKDACGKVMTLSDDASKRIDTSTENARTQALCAIYI